MTFGGDPLTAELLESRISAAIVRRHPILDHGTNAVRLINSEGDDLSAVVVDRYNDVLVVEIANYGVERIAPLLVDVLQRDLAPRLIVLFAPGVPGLLTPIPEVLGGVVLDGVGVLPVALAPGVAV